MLFHLIKPGFANGTKLINHMLVANAGQLLHHRFLVCIGCQPGVKGIIGTTPVVITGAILSPKQGEYKVFIEVGVVGEIFHHTTNGIGVLWVVVQNELTAQRVFTRKELIGLTF